MNTFSHIPSQLTHTLAQYVNADKQKRDRPETYVNALIPKFFRSVDGRPWFYDQNHFKVLSNIENESGVAEFIYDCGGNPTKAKISEVLFQLSRLAMPVPAASVGMNVANGFLELKSGQAVLKPHSEVYGQRYVLPFGYNPNATCPIWMTFLARVMPDVEMQQYLQDFIGYILLGDAKPHAECYGVWLGEGANGKSVALSTLQSLIGHANYSSLSLHEMTSRNTEDLTSKLANIGSETERSANVQTSVLKKMVSLEPIRVEPKYRQHYDIISSAVPVFAVNELPSIDDRSDGIWRRMHLVRWNVTIPEDERDTQLSKKLKTEMEGVLCWAVQGALRVLAKGLAVPRQVKEATKVVRLEANSALLFCNDIIELNEEHYVSKGDLYQAYSTWCKQNGYRAMNLINFSKELKRSIPEAGESKSRIGYLDWRGRKVMTRVNVWTCIHIPAERVERELNVNGHREVLTTAIGSAAVQAELECGLRLVA